MKSNIKDITRRIFCLLLAFHFFNICIDMPDKNPDHIPEDLNINDIESVVELILENGLGIHDAIAEYDEADNDSENFEASKEILLYCEQNKKLDTQLASAEKTKYIKYTVKFPSKYLNEISHPPPQA